MTKFRVLIVAALMTVSSLASAQEATNQPIKKGSKAWTQLEATLRDVELEWLCQGKYYKQRRQDCVDSRGRFWVDQFFEINPGSGVQTKAEMYAGQTAGAKTYKEVAPGEGAVPTDFRLMAVYGNVAMGVDHTYFKVHLDAENKPDFDHTAPAFRSDHWFLDESRKLAVTREVTFLRIFVKENGRWRPAAGAASPLPPSK
ncbi:MAG: hypothetical protein ACRD4Y_03735 [Candidatus Acidiferrales bacterium]